MHFPPRRWLDRLRGAIADYFDQHGGTVTYPCDEAIRTNGYGGITEVMAFAVMHNISMELHCPETDDVSHISCRGSDGAELLLQTLAWQDDGRSAAAGDHWQRLKKKPAAAEGGGGGVATLEFSEIEGTDIDADVVAELPVQIRAEIIAQTSSQCIRHLPTLEAFPSKSFVRRTVLSKCSIPTFALDVCKTNVQLAAASWMRFWPWQRTPTSLRAGERCG